MKKNLFKRVALLLGVLAGVFGLFLLEERLRGGWALGRWTKQMEARGERLTLEELSPKPPVPRRDLEELYAAVGQLTNRVTATGNDVTLADNQSLSWDDLKRQMELAAEPLRRIRQAVKQPPLTAGWDYSSFVGQGQVPHFVRQRTAAQWLTAAVENEVHRGNLEAALENLEALAALARVYQDEPALVNQMIRVAIAGLGTQYTALGLGDAGWTEAQLARLHQAWQQVHVGGPLTLSIEWERAFARRQFESYRRQSFSDIREARGQARGSVPTGVQRVVFWVWKAAWLDQDVLRSLQSATELLDCLRSLERAAGGSERVTWLELAPKLSRLAASGGSEMKPQSSLRHPFGYPIGSSFAPNFAKAIPTCFRNVVQRDLALAGIAVRRYRVANRRLPTNLDALVPGILPAVPRDAMDGKPLRYRVNGDGSWVLYSVGLDGRDDGGVSKSPSPGFATESDIVLWMPAFP